MPRGGVRTGKPGEQYSNRGDLQKGPRTAGQQPVYGEVAQQKAVSATPDAAPMQGPMPPPPGSLPQIVGPTARPDEPVTAGLSTGPGGGPEILSPAVVRDDALFDLRAMLAQFPEYKNLARLIALAEDEI